ncbi:hypothetical protein KCV00_g208, partial [Aureobasidium melanogenum]
MGWRSLLSGMHCTLNPDNAIASAKVVIRIECPQTKTLNLTLLIVRNLSPVDLVVHLRDAHRCSLVTSSTDAPNAAC